MIFCDLSTPKGDGTFNVYAGIKNKLVEKGVPPEEISFIHEANTETGKAELFGKVRSGQVRFLLVRRRKWAQERFERLIEGMKQAQGNEYLST